MRLHLVPDRFSAGRFGRIPFGIAGVGRDGEDVGHA